MNIKKVVNARKIGSFSLRNDGSPQKIKLDYLFGLNNDILVDNSPRVYIFTVDKVIKKIGGSSQTGGIRGTMSFYVNAMAGSPGVPRFVIHLLIEAELRQNRKVELYIITSPRVNATINGFFGQEIMEISSFKEMENLCKTDYFNEENRYPDWNFQENKEPYPSREARLHLQYHQGRLDR